MSTVPAAKQAVAGKLPNNAVTLPQDSKFKEKDVNQKMKMIGAFNAFKMVSTIPTYYLLVNTDSYIILYLTGTYARQ